MGSDPSPERYRAITRANLRRHEAWKRMPEDLQRAVDVVSTVLPFRTNPYVLRELIDWSRVPEDPIYQLTFLQRDMLEAQDFEHMARLLDRGAAKAEIRQDADRIRLKLNPHPAGQMTHNVPRLDGRPLPGLQHKYRETVLFFPSAGQTCHAYCSFCFRWPQFVGLEGHRFEAREAKDMASYLAAHSEVSDLLVTGGDPLVMSTQKLRTFLEPALDPALEHVQNIRIGTKSVAYWPQRFTTDRDADELLRFMERIVSSGRHLAIMGHYNHPRELSTDVARLAVRRIRATGTEIRMQSPVVRHVNDDPSTLAELWLTGVRLGCIPYYLFIERDTGPKGYFEIPLERTWRIFQQAYQSVSGLARTVRGPSMSALPGKVLVDGVTEIHGEKVFALQFLQAREADWVRRPFFARFDPSATWLTDLVPAFGQDEFFYEKVRPDLGRAGAGGAERTPLDLEPASARAGSL